MARRKRRRRPIKHVGFKGAVNQCARYYMRKGDSPSTAKSRCRRIIAARTRAASPAAKRRNPRLKRVRGA